MSKLTGKVDSACVSQNPLSMIDPAIKNKADVHGSMRITNNLTQKVDGRNRKLVIGETLLQLLREEEIGIGQTRKTEEELCDDLLDTDKNLNTDAFVSPFYK